MLLRPGNLGHSEVHDSSRSSLDPAPAYREHLNDEFDEFDEFMNMLWI